MDTLPDSRLDPADVDFIKELIKKNFRFFSVFYDEAHAKMKSLPKEKNDYVPKDVETVKDGYKKAFTQKRSLPPLYWKALAVLLSITPDNLPSRAKAVKEAPVRKNDVPRKEPGLAATNRAPQRPSMTLRFDVDRVEAFRQGVNVPKSTVQIEIDPAQLPQDIRNLIADRLDGIDVCELDCDGKKMEVENPLADGWREVPNFLPVRITAKLPTLEALIEAIKANAISKKKAGGVEAHRHKRNDIEDKSAIENPAPTEQPSNMSPRGDKSLGDWFSLLPLIEIKRYITAIKSAPDSQVQALFDEVLEPQCLNVLIEKLIHGPIEDFVDFYFSDYDIPAEFSPPRIRPAVASAINADRRWRVEHAKQVAQNNFGYLASWFQKFSFFGKRETAIDVETAFVEFSSGSAFRTAYETFSLSDICFLIEGFSEFGCTSAIRVLKDLCFEDDFRRIREAKDEEARKFVETMANSGESSKNWPAQLKAILKNVTKKRRSTGKD